MKAPKNLIVMGEHYILKEEHERELKNLQNMYNFDTALINSNTECIFELREKNKKLKKELEDLKFKILTDNAKDLEKKADKVIKENKAFLGSA